jgi:hypothetical protein
MSWVQVDGGEPHCRSGTDAWLREDGIGNLWEDAAAEAAAEAKDGGERSAMGKHKDR